MSIVGEGCTVVLESQGTYEVQNLSLGVQVFIVLLRRGGLMQNLKG